MKVGTIIINDHITIDDVINVSRFNYKVKLSD